MRGRNDASPSIRAWMRFRKNKPAIFGLVWIIIASLIAVFAYVLAPDGTPNANDQIPQIALCAPRFSCTLLKIRKNTPVEKRNFFRHLFSGTPNPYKLLPIESYQIIGDSVFAKAYKNHEEEYTLPVYQHYHILDVVYPLAVRQTNLNNDKGTYQFLDVDNQSISTDKESLKKEIERQCVQRSFLLGTDRYGRDVWSRLLLGVRISLLVGFVAVLISLTIGILLGAIAGYFGGRIDALVSFIINTVWSIPTLLLVFAIVLALGKNIVNIFIAVGLTMWVDVARIVRGQVLAYKKIQFVEAAQSMGFGDWRIISKHILPNILGPVMVVASANFATAILIEAGLSYLGFGIQPPMPSWGTMLNENYGYALSGKIFLALAPALAIAMMVLAFNLVGNGIRDALDVKGK